MIIKPKQIYLFLGVFLIVLSLIVAVFYQTSQSQAKKGFAGISSTGKIHNPKLTYIEIADSPIERGKGLMNRQDLCYECAMLFVFEEESTQSFWMKNTYISLDIIFLDASGKVVAISQNAEPLNEEKRYISETPAQFALEVKAGFAKNNNILVGDFFKVQEMIDQGVEYNFSKENLK
jgi:uncharacterized membrane protein (UPF0127 family)